MFGRHSLKLLSVTSTRYFHTALKTCKEFEHPFKRTWRILKEDFYRTEQFEAANIEKQRALMGLFPRHADIVIIGGGAIGSSIAYWLKEKTSREGIRVVVIEKDFTYSKCSTILSVGALHQQFSLPENIQMSLFGAEFLRTVKKRFGPGADVQFTPHGYLILADEEGAQKLVEQSYVQKELGATNKLLTKDQLKQKFPWMNVSDIEVGSLGVERGGWFDPWALLTVLRSGAIDLGTQYIEGEVVDFTFRTRDDFIVEGMEESYDSIHEIVVKMPNGEHKTIEFAYCIIAAGIESGELAQLAKIGVGSGMLSVPLPIQKRNRYVYKFDCLAEPPGINTPMTVDYSGIYFRRNGYGGSFISGLSPLETMECNSHDLFHEKILPTLVNRVPAFGTIKLQNEWSGVYENNCFDDNGIVGPHPYYHNLYLATGFSGHGIQQVPAIGRAVAELILDGDFKTVDLSRFGFDRLIVDKPMYEFCVY